MHPCIVECSTYRGGDRWTYGRTDIQIPPAFYMTSSLPVPSGAAALLTLLLPLQNTRAGQGYRCPSLAFGRLVVVVVVVVFFLSS